MPHASVNTLYSNKVKILLPAIVALLPFITLYMEMGDVNERKCVYIKSSNSDAQMLKWWF